MKKYVSALLALVMAASLTACGGGDAPAVSTPAVSAPAVSTPDSAPEVPDVSSEPDASAAPDASQPEEESFDSSWAGADVKIPLPQPPFGVFSVHFQESQNMYIVQDDSDPSARANYDSLAAYCDELKAAGYTQIEKDVLSSGEFQDKLGTVGAATLFEAYNAGGYRVMVYQEESTPMVWVYCP